MTFRHVAILRIDCEPAGKPTAVPAHNRPGMVIEWKHARGPRKGQYKQAWWFKEAVRRAAAATPSVSVQLSGPLRITIKAYMPRPKRMESKKYPDGPIPYTTVPDSDNITKLVKDAINEAKTFWTDDRIVFIDHTEEWYVSRGASPCAVIQIEALEDE